jgi:hypothetical protein
MLIGQASINLTANRRVPKTGQKDTRLGRRLSRFVGKLARVVQCLELIDLFQEG